MKILHNTRDLLAIIDKEIDGIGFKASDRNKISFALFDIALDHAKAIVVLLENKIYASVYALARPLFESFVRAEWIQYCASNDEITYIKEKDAFKLSFGQMLEDVEKKHTWEEILSQVKINSWNSMNSFTHGGLKLIFRRFKDGSLEHNFDEQEIVGLLQFVSLLSFLSFTEIAGISGTNKKDTVLKELYDNMCRWCFNQSVNQAP